MHFIFTLLNRLILKDPIKLVVKRYFRATCSSFFVNFSFNVFLSVYFTFMRARHIDRATCSADVNVRAS